MMKVNSLGSVFLVWWAFVHWWQRKFHSQSSKLLNEVEAEKNSSSKEIQLNWMNRISGWIVKCERNAMDKNVGTNYYFRFSHWILPGMASFH